ncbi:hypothetical protein H2509_15065 [Stappia sp. F7233]|uniref:Uncharacterized protein n=1 Tax=Stappia albiluteola TaxID=2758565 RepID=A0A839AIV8_9HYPH|nr:hypothetical protein [Stappia albiluteola]MBA5778449.1 hypothetical protein [Stappia albiluteola]
MAWRLFLRGLRRATLALPLAVLLHPGNGHAQGISALDNPETDSGWQVDPRGMRHFTGLSCPDNLGRMSRVKILSSQLDRIAGCVYLSPEGIAAVIRSHPKGAGTQAQASFAERFSQAGFTLVDGEGPAASGVTFRIGGAREGMRSETLWRFDGAQMDYTLWMAYTLPLQGALVGPILQAFIEEAASQK